MIRWDKDGNDVSGNPNSWKQSDCEVVRTNFSHPTIMSGQHTNGPASIWIRSLLIADGEWLLMESKHMHVVREHWKNLKLLNQSGEGGSIPPAEKSASSIGRTPLVFER